MRPNDNQPISVLDDFAHDQKDGPSCFHSDGRDRPFASLIVDIDVDLALGPSIRDNVCHWTTRFNENETSPAPGSVQPCKRLVAERNRRAASREFI
jgi:hypothetical protein